MDIDELNLNKKYLIICFILGALSSIFIDDFEIDFRFIREGMLAGFGIGLVWTALRYKKDNLEGLEYARKGIGSFIFYLFSYICGFLIFFVIKKIIMLFLV